MGHKKNKRTLKKRVRKVIFYSIFLTVLIFSSITIFFAAQVFKTEAVFVSDYMSKNMASQINSRAFLLQMGITSLDEFNPNSVAAREWVAEISRNEKDVLKHDLEHVTSPDKAAKLKKLVPDSDPDEQKFLLNVPGMENMIQTSIEINDTLVYASPNIVTAEQSHNPVTRLLLNFFSSAEASNPIFNSKGEVVGNVTTHFNTQFLTFLYTFILVFIIICALLSIFLANLIGKLLSISITTPLTNLDKKMSDLASEEYESGMDKQIVLKKPLREIESLAGSANLIMRKMQEYNRLLEEQKVTLENQNEELEAQNEELIDSKQKIEAAQTMLVQSENMASIGQLTAAITHEINTPLGAISSNVQMYDMLLKSVEELPEVKACEDLSGTIASMKETNDVNLMACKRVTEIIKSLKTFSKLDQAEFQEASLNDGIRSVLVLTSNLWKKKITIHEDYGDLPMVKCFSGLLNQVFMNIVVNAIQAIQDKGDIYIRTYENENSVLVSVRDTGVGIKKENLPRIFESGFSTKISGVGAGLGLSICQNIVQKHNGKITVETEEGKGTEFLVEIPKFREKT